LLISYFLKEAIIFRVLLQDVINDVEIKLDWFFKTSLIHDLVHVSVICYYGLNIIIINMIIKAPQSAESLRTEDATIQTWVNYNNCS